MSTPYTIRPATAEDSETIKRMVRSERLDPSAIDWRYFMVLEVVEDGKPKIVSIAMVRPVGNIHEVDSVTTRSEYREHGYAGALMHALIERASTPLYLLAETDLVDYYERFGFRVLRGDDAPGVMRAQAEYVNRMFGGRVVYHVMGNPHASS
jgi:N-acetylglutamate synthase-like GNAT family acetyltransferase